MADSKWRTVTRWHPPLLKLCLWVTVFTINSNCHGIIQAGSTSSTWSQSIVSECTLSFVELLLSFELSGLHALWTLSVWLGIVRRSLARFALLQRYVSILWISGFALLLWYVSILWLSRFALLQWYVSIRWLSVDGGVSSILRCAAQVWTQWRSLFMKVSLMASYDCSSSITSVDKWLRFKVLTGFTLGLLIHDIWSWSCDIVSTLDGLGRYKPASKPPSSQYRHVP